MEQKLRVFSVFSRELADNVEFIASQKAIVNIIIESIERGGIVYICGNGGSASQASHMVGELVGRFRFDRPALPAVSLFDFATTTAIGNDYGYDETFSRFIVGLGKPADVLVSLSTSGNSRNCIRAMEEASKKDMKTVSFLGRDGGKMKDISDAAIVVPSEDTPTIQEIHLMILHDVCDRVEQRFFGNARDISPL
ncbi:MAG: SIS domain-containing protein [Candidatus Moranbacteria bacterium]|nr:SIS domain-containing protein [Candidatus Moranbacteria bacterium]